MHLLPNQGTLQGAVQDCTELTLEKDTLECFSKQVN